MFERFTDRARRVVVLAQEEARMLNHNYIGTEHILLGLIHEGEGVAAKALESLGISLEAVRSQVEEIIGQGQAAPTGHIPFTPRAKKVLELSLREALQLGHNYIGTEHIAGRRNGSTEARCPNPGDRGDPHTVRAHIQYTGTATISGCRRQESNLRHTESSRGRHCLFQREAKLQRSAFDGAGEPWRPAE